MVAQEKSDLIVDAIAHAEKTGYGQYFIDRTAENGLKGLPDADFYSALRKLRDQERVISAKLPGDPVRELNKRIVIISRGYEKVLSDPKPSPKPPDHTHEFLFSKTPIFDNWYAAHLLKRNSDFSSLTALNQDKIWITLLDIEEKLQMVSSNQMTISLFFNHTTPLIPSNFITGPFRGEALDYLKNKGVVYSYDIRPMGLSSYVSLNFDIPKFQGLKKAVETVIATRDKPPTPQREKPKVPDSNFHLETALKNFEGLSPANKDKVWITIRDIEEASEIFIDGPPIKMEIPLLSHRRTNLIGDNASSGSARNDALLFLFQIEAIKLFHIKQRGQDDFVEIYPSPIEFNSFKKAMDSIYTPEIQPTIVPEEAGDALKEGIIYEIVYTQSREILVNNFLIGKPDFNGENDNVFGYLFKHPNVPVSLDDLGKVLGGKPPKKALSKIVENLGFCGELKSIFFSVSKTTIMFKNPITRAHLATSKTSLLKLSLK
jgi:hypothetical protein